MRVSSQPPERRSLIGELGTIEFKHFTKTPQKLYPGHVPDGEGEYLYHVQLYRRPEFDTEVSLQGGSRKFPLLLWRRGGPVSRNLFVTILGEPPMKIPELELEIVVASRDSAKRLTHAEPALSCVISIHGKSEMPAQLPDARAVESFVFDDVIRDEPRPELFAPRVGHALGILEAAKRFRGQPLLVHWSLESLPTGSQRYSRLKACATSIRFNASTLLTF